MITVNDLASFFTSVAAAYEDYLLMGLSLMIAMSLLLGVKRIFVSGND